MPNPLQDEDDSSAWRYIDDEEDDFAAHNNTVGGGGMVDSTSSCFSDGSMDSLMMSSAASAHSLTLSQLMNNCGDIDSRDYHTAVRQQPQYCAVAQPDDASDDDFSRELTFTDALRYFDDMRESVA